LQDNVKAIFGPTSSAVAAAEEHVAAQYQVPIFLIASNDISLTTTHFTKYAFQLLPSSYMEPHAIAAYMAKKGWENYFTIAPDYSFGHNSVKQFLVAMKDYGAKINVVGQQWPKLGATDYTSYITAILSDHPDAVYAELYGGDLLTFTKQAEGFDLFQKVHAYALYTQGVLKALGKKAPAGVITSSRAPFYAIHTADMRRFTAAYHKEYGDWPSAWALIAYTGVQTWAQGVKKAHSFDGEKVSAALSGATVKTIRGPIKLRACDHQAELPEYVGPLSEKINPKYGFRTIHPIYTPEVKKIMMSCSQVRAQQPD
jgi:branched-chain amino acid transport system substrate-binding protein